MTKSNDKTACKVNNTSKKSTETYTQDDKNSKSELRIWEKATNKNFQADIPMNQT